MILKFKALRSILVASVLGLFGAGMARASVSLLLEEPFGTFGAFNPTGHAALYLSGVCADQPTRLRLCREGELGVVVSRYHHVRNYDWVAIPLVPYLYAVEDLSQVPLVASPAVRASLRDAYRRQHLLDLAPNREDGGTPGGEWIQLVGSSYDRRIYGFQLATTRQQDEMLVAMLNDRRNRSHFNLFFSNCADFSRSLLRVLYPHSIPHNALADFGLTTPKHLARSVTQLGAARPELEYRYFQIPQIPGSIPRSHSVNGIAESLVRSKKYALPLVYLSPPTAIGLLAAYVGTGRFSPPRNAPMMPELTPEPAPITLRSNAIVVGLAQTNTTADDLTCTPAPQETIQIAAGGGAQ